MPQTPLLLIHAASLWKINWIARIIHRRLILSRTVGEQSVACCGRPKARTAPFPLLSDFALWFKAADDERKIQPGAVDGIERTAAPMWR